MRFLKILVLITCILLLLSISGNIYLFFKKNIPVSEKSVRLNTEYPLLSPRIYLIEDAYREVNFSNLRTTLRASLEQVKSPIGVWFEYLPTGVTIGVNEKTEFASASLFKTPMAMAVMKSIEEKTAHLDDVLTLKESHLDRAYGSVWQKGAGSQLTVKEALEHMLKESDNTSLWVLQEYLPMTALEQVYNALDIEKKITTTELIITPKSYSSILRSLYFSAYLSEASSEYILDLLSTTPFDSQLRAEIPSSITVAHKIGIIGIGKNREPTVSDCGIIYVPNQNYIVCMMMKSSLDEATPIFKALSGLIYRYVSGENRNPEKIQFSSIK